MRSHGDPVTTGATPGVLGMLARGPSLQTGARSRRGLGTRINRRTHGAAQLNGWEGRQAPTRPEGALQAGGQSLEVRLQPRMLRLQLLDPGVGGPQVVVEAQRLELLRRLLKSYSAERRRYPLDRMRRARERLARRQSSSAPADGQSPPPDGRRTESACRGKSCSSPPKYGRASCRFRGGGALSTWGCTGTAAWSGSA